MNNYVILTDSSCDLPNEICERMDIEVIPLTVHLEGKAYHNYLDWRELSPANFYNALRSGKIATTAAANVDDFLLAFRNCLTAGKDVIYIGLSSALSSTFSGAVAAINLLESEYDSFIGRRIYAVDSRCGGLGLGLLAYLAAKAREAGMALDSLRDYIENTKLRVCHWITVSDLNHFRRGGRLSYTTAFFGTILGIRPILHLSSESILEAYAKVRGQKNAVAALADKLNYAENISESTIFVGHTGCPIDAAVLAGEVRARFKPKDIIIGNVGPAIGSHAGPDALALFFLGDRDMPKSK
ncbi:MAG: DegV family protein [Oscillospiraceae bacterium]